MTMYCRFVAMFRVLPRFLSCLVLSLAVLSPPVMAQQAPAPDAPASVIDSNSNIYIIGPGDTLQVFVWRNPELSTTVPVRPDGRISTPLVQDMVAVGKTPAQLKADIEKVLGEYVRSPQVNIIITGPTSAFSQVKVIGQVGSPQSVPYREGLKVLDVILACGGLGEFASGNKAQIIRVQNGKETKIRVKLADLLRKGDMRQNIEMQRGDVLVVPESLF